jgi:tRNA dimethylallyltransferase
VHLSLDPLVKPLLIAGPTASGKSAYAMTRAAERPSVIINADSMQVYRDLSVLTARPEVADEAAVPHRLYGHVDGAEAYSAGRFAREVADVLVAAGRDGLRPIIVGGTGLYFSALLSGLSPIPEIPANVRARWREAAAALEPGELHRLLAARDPVMAARLHPSDPQRIIRALEVLDATGRSLALWQATPGTPILAAEACERVVIMPERARLMARIEARLERMVEAGALDEVGRLTARGLPPDLPIMRALGVVEFAAHLAGHSTLAEALGRTTDATRAYVKRQLTWIKRNMIAWKVKKIE